LPARIGRHQNAFLLGTHVSSLSGNSSLKRSFNLRPSFSAPQQVSVLKPVLYLFPIVRETQLSALESISERARDLTVLKTLSRFSFEGLHSSGSSPLLFEPPILFRIDQKPEVFPPWRASLSPIDFFFEISTPLFPLFVHDHLEDLRVKYDFLEVSNIQPTSKRLSPTFKCISSFNLSFRSRSGVASQSYFFFFFPRPIPKPRLVFHPWLTDAGRVGRNLTYNFSSISSPLFYLFE